MNRELVIASIDRAGDHAGLLGVLVLVAAIGGLIYGLVRIAAKNRAGRTRSAPGPESDRRPDA
jgi:hypothetical protein